MLLLLLKIKHKVFIFRDLLSCISIILVPYSQWIYLTILYKKRHRIENSQVEVRKCLWKLPGPSLLLKQGNLKSLCPRQRPDSFGILPGMEILPPHRATFSSSGSSPRWKSVQREPSAFQFGPIASCPATGCHSNSFHPPGILLFGVYTHYWEPPWASTSTGWAVLSLSVIPYVRGAVAPPSSLWISKTFIRTI